MRKSHGLLKTKKPLKLRWLLVSLVAVFVVSGLTIGARGLIVNRLAKADTASAFQIKGVDLHDGMIAHFGNKYYLYGTEYKCGFQWSVAGTPWCGFGVSTADSLAGPWSAPQLLFSVDAHDPYSGQTWAGICTSAGSAGCFNPRMVQRPDGVYILWFNDPAQYALTHANAYNTMGCNGPAGPCGAEAGAPHGSSHKPALYICASNGDFTIATDGPNAYIICTTPGQGFSEEKLDSNWTNGVNVGSANWAGFSQVEGPGAYKDPATGKWVLTYSKPNCGYCTGAGTAYALADSPAGPWKVPADTGFGVGVGGRRYLSATSCGGQPRTVSVVDSQAWQVVDLWTGSRNEAGATSYFIPLNYNPTLSHGTAGDGQPWHAPFADWTCQ
jgi:hypothetical protein